MKPGIWTSFFIDLPLEEMVAAFARSGWSHLELSDEHAAALLHRGDPVRAGRSFRDFALEHGVTFPQGHLWLTVDIAVRDRGEVVDRLKEWLDLFLALEIRAAVLHPGGSALIEQGRDAREVLEMRVRALRPLARHVANTELTLCLENDTEAPEVDDLLEIVDAVGSSHVGICLDTGHLNFASRDQRGFLERAGSRLRALHIADNDGSSDQHLMPYGLGTVCWDDVLPALEKIRYDGLFSLEIPGEARCPMAIRLAKLEYLKKIVPLMIGRRLSEGAKRGSFGE